MDTLLVPPDPTLPRERARYVCKEPWDDMRDAKVA